MCIRDSRNGAGGRGSQRAPGQAASRPRHGACLPSARRPRNARCAREDLDGRARTLRHLRSRPPVPQDGGWPTSTCYAGGLEGASAMTYKRKLIEVALPLEAINRESAREKSIRHGHPSTLHLWWARRPLAACRAVLFAQLVDDPSAHPDKFPTEQAQAVERRRLFDLIERLVVWENSGNEALFRQAYNEIAKCFDGKPPAILDPFCGGGSIPLEAQRLGLEAHASDLNPVAVLITKALIEIPPKWAGRPPVFPGAAESRLDWSRATGLAEDVRRYGQWMRDEAEKRIGHLYPKATLPDGSKASVIAWIWARTVTCPNPACGIEMPLVRSWWLGKKQGKEAYVVPRVENGRVEFGTEHEKAADVPVPDDVPDTEIPHNPRYLTTPNYGMTRHAVHPAPAHRPHHVRRSRGRGAREGVRRCPRHRRSGGRAAGGRRPGRSRIRRQRCGLPRIYS